MVFFYNFLFIAHCLQDVLVKYMLPTVGSWKPTSETAVISSFTKILLSQYCKQAYCIGSILV